ncbi:indolepyruvate ferredoxin oxidoreductase [candidate division KSB3 bacterium]|uniref:Indolepyruvate oxidoreductase subunit IorA n=1 Tax=candidate division KSB3 bacterium TaxID=2044937 RepID=A0A2G6EA59_9BACT|nr:MAG: indolepyruvate ferredoxin oxidoreductase [candidate division KSB3 bacterium]PIE31005.1 MAG: indolepyruvate ferredoxin oxidoreductase [candidate division KSB3 bacterium]
MDKLLLLGDEALAQGALDAGLSGVYAYPGTPSTEITEYIQRNQAAIERNVHREWSANEKTALESALGMSYAGKRAMTCMKHVGLNVAADPFMNSALTGANGGIIITVADDPSMHSSQNEQDSRFYVKFAGIPALEPSNQQEAYDMAFHAFELSERYNTPVLIRLTTRLAHSRSGILRRDVLSENELKLPDDPNQFVLLPAIARKRYKHVLTQQKAFENESEQSPFNACHDGQDTSLGIIACGLAYNYLMEQWEDGICPYPVLKISQYPLPRKLVERIITACNDILVLEEGMPLVEEMLRAFPAASDNMSASLKGPSIQGRLSGALPRDGELNPNLVAAALGLNNKSWAAVPDIVATRPPELCKGCSHRDAYHALNEALEPYGRGHVFSDIGCYTLGFLPPFQSINTCVDMGASITMAKGAADAKFKPAIAVIGDSTFIHSGITGLLDAVWENSNIVVMILDNATTAMTGGQDHAGTGKLEDICKGLGVAEEHIRILKPLPKNHDKMVQTIKEEIAYKGVSVLILRRECIQTLVRRKRQQKA